MGSRASRRRDMRCRSWPANSKATEAEKKQALQVVALLKKDAGARSPAELGAIAELLPGPGRRTSSGGVRRR